MSCPTGAWELPCSAYYITELQRKKLVKNETNFRRELLFQSPGSHASFFSPIRIYFYLLYLSIHLFFCTCLAAPLFLPFLLLMASILHQSFLSAFYCSLFHNSSSLIYTSLLSFLIILNLYAPLFLPCILIALPPSTHFIIFTFALSHHILPVFVVPSCSPPAALVVLNAPWLGAAGRMAAVLP